MQACQHTSIRPGGLGTRSRVVPRFGLVAKMAPNIQGGPWRQTESGLFVFNVYFRNGSTAEHLDVQH
eukprot:14856045-Alexandrium_andersonii.AAC.1